MGLTVELEFLCFCRGRSGILFGLRAVLGNAVDDNIGVGRVCEVKVRLGRLAGYGITRGAACRYVKIEVALLSVVRHQRAAPSAVVIDSILIGRFVIDVALEARPVLDGQGIFDKYIDTGGSGSLFGIGINIFGAVACRVGGGQVQGDGLAYIVVGADADGGVCSRSRCGWWCCR